MRAKFKRWFVKQNPHLWGYETPVFDTYRDKGHSQNDCRHLNVRMDDFWWPNTYAAYEGFKANGG